MNSTTPWGVTVAGTLLCSSLPQCIQELAQTCGWQHNSMRVKYAPQYWSGALKTSGMAKRPIVHIYVVCHAYVAAEGYEHKV